MKSAEQQALLTKTVRASLTLFGPPILQQGNRPGLGLHDCRRCRERRAAELFGCVRCDEIFETRWQWQLHMITEPRYCTDRGDKKVKTWARNA